MYLGQEAKSQQIREEIERAFQQKRCAYYSYIHNRQCTAPRALGGRYCHYHPRSNRDFNIETHRPEADDWMDVFLVEREQNNVVE
eukprot:15241-Eustigmatos_ZCMA.PRE.1